MKKGKGIIKKIRGTKPLTDADKHIARITGKRSIPKSSYYRNVETGDEYSYLVGSLAWPGNGVPGFSVIVAVDRTDDPNPAFRVLEELEEEDVGRLLERCIGLRERWGYLECAELLRIWWGDAERFMTFTTEMNQRLLKDGKGNGLCISAPVDFDKANRFELYLRRIQSCLIKDNQGKKRLVLGSCDKLRGHLQTMPPNIALDWSEEDFPAVASLGYAIHGLMVLEPWKHNIDWPLENREGSYEEYAFREQYEAMKHLGVEGPEYEELGTASDGELVSTIR